MEDFSYYAAATHILYCMFSTVDLFDLKASHGER
jgi:hypothetical protein